MEIFRLPPFGKLLIGLSFSILEMQLSSANIHADSAQFVTLISYPSHEVLISIQNIILGEAGYRFLFAKPRFIEQNPQPDAHIAICIF